MSKNDQPDKTVAILICPGVTMLDLVGTHAFLNGLAMAKYRVFTVAASRDALQSDTPLKVVPEQSLAELTDPSILAVIGGGVPWLKALGDAAILEYVRDAAASAELLISTGTGSLLLAAAGLLKDRPATTYWPFSALLEALGARYLEQRWLEDGKIVTCAAGTGGIDYSLKLVSRLAGEGSARMLQMSAEYDPQPPFSALDWTHQNGNNPYPLVQSELEVVRQALAAQPHVLQAFASWAGEKQKVL